MDPLLLLTIEEIKEDIKEIKQDLQAIKIYEANRTGKQIGAGMVVMAIIGIIGQVIQFYLNH